MSAQSITKSDFTKSDWFVGFSGENLFVPDTLKISKLTTIEPKKYSHLWMFVEMDYLKVDLFSALKFRKDKVFIEVVRKEWGGFNFSNQINWKFDSEKQSLLFYKNDNLIAEYEIISKETGFTEWSNNEDEKPIRLTANILTLKLSKLRK